MFSGFFTVSLYRCNVRSSSVVAFLGDKPGADILSVFEPGDETLAVENGDDSGKRNRDEDSDWAEELATDDDRNQGDKGRHAEGVAEKVRLDDVTVDRLQDQGEDDEYQCVHRVFEQEDKCADSTANDRTECRKDICHTDNDGNERHVRKAYDQHENGVDDADTDGFKDRIADVFCKDCAASLQEFRVFLILLICQESVTETADAGVEFLLAGEEVDSEDDAHEDVDQHCTDAEDSVHGARKVRGEIGDRGIGPVVDIRCPLCGIELDIIFSSEFVEFGEVFV